MNATILDLRYKTSQVLAALDHRETVTVLYHGKVKGVITPVLQKTMKVQEHAFFGSSAEGDQDTDVQDVMRTLRGGRYDAL